MKILTIALLCILLCACTSIHRPDVALDLEYNGKRVYINNPPEYDDPEHPGYDPSNYTVFVWFMWDY